MPLHQPTVQEKRELIAQYSQEVILVDDETIPPGQSTPPPELQQEEPLAIPELELHPRGAVASGSEIEPIAISSSEPSNVTSGSTTATASMELPKDAAALAEPKDVVMGADEEIAAGPVSPIPEMDVNANVIVHQKEDQAPGETRH